MWFLQNWATHTKTNKMDEYCTTTGKSKNMTQFWFVISRWCLHLQLVAVCTVQHAARSCVCCWWVMIHLSLNLERLLAARVAVGKFVSSWCQAFVPIRCVSGERGVPGTSPLSLPPLLLKDDNDKSVGVEWSGWGVKIPFWFPANGARAVQFGHPESPPKWRRAGGARYHKASPHSGLFIPHVRDIPEVIFGELTEMETGSNRGMILYTTP